MLISPYKSTGFTSDMFERIIVLEIRCSDIEDRAALLRQFCVGVMEGDTYIIARVRPGKDHLAALMLAGEDLQSEQWYLEGHEEQIDHREDGPSFTVKKLKGHGGHYALWGKRLNPEDVTEAVKDGVAHDHDAFRAWWPKRKKKMLRKGYVEYGPM